MINDLPTKRVTCDRHFSEFLPTRWRQKSSVIDMEQNYVTVTLCISKLIRFTDSFRAQNLWNYFFLFPLSTILWLFHFNPVCVIRGKPYKLFAPRTVVNIKKHYFCVRVIEPWNNPNCATVDFSSLRRFKCFLRRTDLSQYLKHSDLQTATVPSPLLIFDLNVLSFHVGLFS